MYLLLHQYHLKLVKIQIPGSYHRPTESLGLETREFIFLISIPIWVLNCLLKSNSDGTRICSCSSSDSLCSSSDLTVLWVFLASLAVPPFLGDNSHGRGDQVSTIAVLFTSLKHWGQHANSNVHRTSPTHLFKKTNEIHSHIQNNSVTIFLFQKIS